MREEEGERRRKKKEREKQRGEVRRGERRKRRGERREKKMFAEFLIGWQSLKLPSLKSRLSFPLGFKLALFISVKNSFICPWSLLSWSSNILLVL
jgi:hypothetical protein